jgi:hypothetical protein
MMAASPNKQNSFNELAAAQGLNEKTMQVLEEQDCGDLGVIRLMNKEDIDKLSITLGQKITLSEWIKQLNLQPETKLPVYNDQVRPDHVTPQGMHNTFITNLCT